MSNQTLKFGRFKGKLLSETPIWYQDWLSKQTWFNKTPDNNKPLHHKLRGWDGYSKKGQAVYDSIFEQEQRDADKYDPVPDWMYQGVN